MGSLVAAIFLLSAFANGASGFLQPARHARTPYLQFDQRFDHDSQAFLTATGNRFSSQMKRRKTSLYVSDPSLLLMTNSVQKTSQFLVRIVLLRAMAFVHLVAFLVALHQNKALIGDDGITPAKNVLNAAEMRGKLIKEHRKHKDDDARGTPEQQPATPILKSFRQSSLSRFIQNNPKLSRLQNKFANLRELLWDRCDVMHRPVITLLWLAKDRNKLNPWLDAIAIAGLSMSALILLLGSANVPLVFGLWLCQRSLMSVGSPFYGFGWEPQLNELSFHALLLVPLLSLQQIPHLPVSPIIAWTFRWMLFRIMMGAGLIKFRSGDTKWKDGTAMQYFYETQPVPNPLSRYFHWMPKPWHTFEVWANHFVEVLAPWLLIIPGLPLSWRRAAGLIQINFQAILILSGNLSFLNWLTMVPAIMCVDDGFVGGLFSASTRTRAMGAAWTYSTSTGRQLVNVGFLGLVAWLSIPVVKNLLSEKQIMNFSFDPLRLINTYGAFGTVGEEREEFIISAAPDFDGPWKEYEFKVKPGDVNKHPRWISPYHYRLDWQLWIASACRSLDRSPWLLSLLLKLLQRNEAVLNLLDGDPWKGYAEKPKYIRVDRYRYKFHKPTSRNDPVFWDREYVGRVYPRQGLATQEGIKDDIRRLRLLYG
ncbi:hypothetical protein MPSEU_000385600 [Mayamaea pseudoterrestris]|nr:hypothetical protein MPSEU_000385600 [Mayamaea pseudoterrestris]